MSNLDSELDKIVTTLFHSYDARGNQLAIDEAKTKLQQWSAKREKHALMDGIAHGTIVDNIRLVVNSDIPAEWTTPVTNKKLYNEAAVAKRKLEARLDTAKTALKACPTKDDMLRLWLQQHIKDIKEIATLNKELEDL